LNISKFIYSKFFNSPNSITIVIFLNLLSFIYSKFLNQNENIFNFIIFDKIDSINKEKIVNENKIDNIFSNLSQLIILKTIPIDYYKSLNDDFNLKIYKFLKNK
jgi:hypothetical protein